MPNNKFHEPREGRQGREVRNKVFTDYLKVLEYHNARAATEAEWEARYEARRSRQEARSEAAAPPVTPKAPPEPPRQYPLFPEAPRSPLKDRPQHRGNWGDLPASSNNPNVDVYPAAFTAEERRQMYARENLTRAMGRDVRRKQAALDRAVFLCNRLLENRFPEVPFSELEMIPTGPQYLGHPPDYDRSFMYSRKDDDDDETT